MLSFSSIKARTDADFQILYDNPKNWNDAGYFILYRIYALTHITGGETIPLGRLLLVSTEQQIKEPDALARIMSNNTVFNILPEGFHSLMISKNGAQRLFCLLTPEQRKEFCSALHLCLSLEECKELSKNTLFYRTLFRRVYDNRYKEQVVDNKIIRTYQEEEMWNRFDQEDLLPVRKYLCSELTMDDLHKTIILRDE